MKCMNVNNVCKKFRIYFNVAVVTGLCKEICSEEFDEVSMGWRRFSMSKSMLFVNARNPPQRRLYVMMFPVVCCLLILSESWLCAWIDSSKLEWANDEDDHSSLSNPRDSDFSKTYPSNSCLYLNKSSSWPKSTALEEDFWGTDWGDGMEGVVFERPPTPQELARWRMGEKIRPEDNWTKAMRETKMVTKLFMFWFQVFVLSRVKLNVT